MSRVGSTVALAMAMTLAACGGGEDDPERFGEPPAGAEEVSTPDGTVYLADNTIYGSCAVIKPHDGEFNEWLGREPEGDQYAFAYVCADDP